LPPKVIAPKHSVLTCTPVRPNERYSIVILLSFPAPPWGAAISARCVA